MVADNKKLSSKGKTKQEVTCDLILDTEIDKLLDEKAARTNLTVFNVKSIIRQIISNQMVHKMVVLQARQKEREDNQENVDVSSTEPACDDDDMIFLYEPKLTRAKTKELNQNNDQSQIPMWPISPAKFMHVRPPTPSEAQMLITEQDLPEESEAEDDEYVPKELDFHASDDDASVTSVSDIGSPATPNIPRTVVTSGRGRRKRDSILGGGSPSPSRIANRDDALFKTPSPRKQLNFQQHNAIGLRTRSKLPLNDTPLEYLEKQLIPPDITTDMYEWNDTDNEDYLQFLKAFAVSSMPEGNDDEEADPEYNVMEDEEDDHDREEHRSDRAVKVTKKELNELIAELFDGYHLSNSDDLEDISSSLTQHSFPTERITKSSSAVKREKLPSSTTAEVALSSIGDFDVLVKRTATASTSTSNESSARKSDDFLDIQITKPEAQPPPTLHALPTETPVQEQSLPFIPHPLSPVPIVMPVLTTIELPLFTPELYFTLRQQIQKHIQLLATTYVISSGVDIPQVVKAAHSAKSLLLEIVSSAESNGANSVYSGSNLQPAVEILRKWPPRVHTNSPIKKKILEEHGYKPTSQSQLSEKSTELSDYEKKVIKLIGESSAFMYPSLLPCYFTPFHQPVILFTSGEDSLIARAIDELKYEYHKMISLSNLISQVFLPIRTTTQIFNRIRNVKKSKDIVFGTITGTPLKDYFITKIPPRVIDDLYYPTEAIPPIYQPQEVLCPKWQLLTKSIINNTLLQQTISPKTYALFQEAVAKKQTKGSTSASKKQKRKDGDASEEVNSTAKIQNITNLSSSVVEIGKSSSEYQVFAVTNDNGEPQFYYSVPTAFDSARNDILLLSDGGETKTENEQTTKDGNSQKDEVIASSTVTTSAVEPMESSTQGSKGQDEDDDENDKNNERKKSRYEQSVIDLDAAENEETTDEESQRQAQINITSEETGEVSILSPEQISNISTVKPPSPEIKMSSSKMPYQKPRKEIPSRSSPSRNSLSSRGNRKHKYEIVNDDDENDKALKLLHEKVIVDDQTEENIETTDEESHSDHTKGIETEKEKAQKDISISTPDKRGIDTLLKTPSSNKRKKIPSGSGGCLSSNSLSPRSNTGSKRHKYNTTPVELLLETNTQEDEDIVDAFTEAYLINMRQKVEGRNPSLYTTFIQVLNEFAVTGCTNDELFRKVEELFKDYPDLIKEFGGLQSAEAAFSTGNFVQYQETHAQVYFLQLLEKWTVNCPQLKTKIIQKLKSLQEANLTETKVIDVMQPLFSQIETPLVVDAFKALFPSIFRPQTNLSYADYEEVEFDSEETTKQDSLVHSHDPLTTEIEMDSYETVKLPEEKQVIATNTCPCACHEDPNNVHFHTRFKHCNKCCLRFQDGKLFMHSGRVMKPVSIGFTSSELAKQVLAPPYLQVKITRLTSSPSTSVSVKKTI